MNEVSKHQQNAVKKTGKQINSNNNTAGNLFTFIDIPRSQRHSPAFIDCLPSDINGKTEQSTGIQKEFSQSCVKTHCV